MWSDSARTVRCLGPGTMPSPFPARPVQRCQCLPVVAYRSTPMQPHWQRPMLVWPGTGPQAPCQFQRERHPGPPFCWFVGARILILRTFRRCLPDPVSAGLLMLLRHTLVSDEGDMGLVVC